MGMTNLMTGARSLCTPYLYVFFRLMTSELFMPLNLIMIVFCYSVLWILFECGALQISWNLALMEQTIAFSKKTNTSACSYRRC